MKKSVLSIVVLSLALLLAGNVSADTPIPPGQAHVVQPGDYLSNLAREYYDDAQAWPAIVEATNAKAVVDSSFAIIVDPSALRVGQKLWIPTQAVDPHTAPAPTNGTAAVTSPAGEQDAAQYFDTIRERPPLLVNFLTRMPKGGDLHIHLSGAIYAESYIEWGAEDELCINETTMEAASCDEEAERPIEEALTNSAFYGQIIDAWSMRNWELAGQSGHDHFFDTFGKYGGATYGRSAEMIAQATRQAAEEQVGYLELMLTLTDRTPRQIGEQVGWDDDLSTMRDGILANGLPDTIAASQQIIDEVEAEYWELLHCDDQDQAEPACDVVVRYIHQVKRYLPPEQVFAQMLAGYELTIADPRVVGLNMVAPEDGRTSMSDYSLHMRMLGYLHQVYPDVTVALHAGELTLGLVPTAGLRFHVREAVEVAHARRIGHGVDIMYEDGAFELLAEMAEQGVMVEICLSSNDLILGVSGDEHPLPVYMQYGVPVALATDDPGISRVNMTHEYQKAVKEHGLDYLQLKTMARTSLEYAFAEGTSLWVDFEELVPVEDCAGDLAGDSTDAQQPSVTCQQFLDENLKAQIQWDLEQDFWQFESTCCTR